MAGQLDDVVIVEAVRTPIGRRNGSLKDVRPDELMALTLSALIRRTGIDPGLVDDVILGCVAQVGEQGANVARLAVLEAGFPVEVPAVSLDRMCSSGQQAVHFAAQAIGSEIICFAFASATGKAPSARSRCSYARCRWRGIG